MNRRLMKTVVRRLFRFAWTGTIVCLSLIGVLTLADIAVAVASGSFMPMQDAPSPAGTDEQRAVFGLRYGRAGLYGTEPETAEWKWRAVDRSGTTLRREWERVSEREMLLRLWGVGRDLVEGTSDDELYRVKVRFERAGDERVEGGMVFSSALDAHDNVTYQAQQRVRVLERLENGWVRVSIERLDEKSVVMPQWSWVDAARIE